MNTTTAAAPAGTAPIQDRAAFEVARLTGHTLYCAGHCVACYDENWADSRDEDPTAEWCKGEPTLADLIEGGRDLVSGLCYCENAR